MTRAHVRSRTPSKIEMRKSGARIAAGQGRIATWRSIVCTAYGDHDRYPARRDRVGAALRGGEGAAGGGGGRPG